jgi:hypothetical protein
VEAHDSSGLELPGVRKRDDPAADDVDVADAEVAPAAQDFLDRREADDVEALLEVSVGDPGAGGKPRVVDASPSRLSPPSQLIGRRRSCSKG